MNFKSLIKNNKFYALLILIIFILASLKPNIEGLVSCNEAKNCNECVNSKMKKFGEFGELSANCYWNSNTKKCDIIQKPGYSQFCTTNDDLKTSYNFDKPSNLVLNLDLLQQKYNNLLISYKQAINDYVSYINSGLNSRDFIIIKNQALSGNNILNVNVISAEECKAKCVSNTNCSGATYDSTSRNCILNSGETNLLNAKSNLSAIVSKSLNLLKKIDDLNSQLIDLNKQIIEKIKITEPVYSNQLELRGANSEDLEQRYTNLLEEREELLKLMKEYETLEETQKQTGISVNSNYYNYMLYFLITLLFIVLLTRFSISI